jgi:hypothetical protein
MGYQVFFQTLELKQVLKIVEDLADYIALGMTGEIEKRQWSGINFFFYFGNTQSCLLKR